ncbi:MAG: putative ABC transporter permease [Clostridium sp.]|nr:putative ABC transporter permease [Clostridium sp.]
MKTHSNRTQEHLDTMLLLFFTVSVSGYLWEILLYFLMNGTFTNRGFFHGPWLPVYGLGAVLLAALLERLPARLKKRLPLLFFLSALVCTATEYLLGLYLETRRHVRYWDYTGWPLSIGGKVCLISFVFFGLGGLLLERRLLPFLRRIPQRLALRRIRGVNYLHIALGALCLLFLVDLFYSYAHPNMGNNISFRIAESAASMP